VEDHQQVALVQGRNLAAQRQEVARLADRPDDVGQPGDVGLLLGAASGAAARCGAAAGAPGAESRRCRPG
jgi:hypothetical protein